MKADLGIFPQKRGSLGNMISPTGRETNAKAGTFAFGSQVQSGRSVTVKPAMKKQNLKFMSTESGMVGVDPASQTLNSSNQQINGTFRTTMKSLQSNLSG